MSLLKKTIGNIVLQNTKAEIHSLSFFKPILRKFVEIKTT